MAAAWNPPLPRLPQALARHQEALPLTPHKRIHPPAVQTQVISLASMCCKFWLERVQYVLRRDLPKAQVFALHRFLTQLPRELRACMIHNALRSGGLHLSHGSREMPSVNRALVLLTSELPVREPVYITLPKTAPEGVDWPPDLELLIRSGEGVQKLVLFLPVSIGDPVKKLLTDICRTCRRLQHITLHQATDDVITLVARHCPFLVSLDVSGSEMVTDEGLARVVVNVKWGTNEPRLNYIDLDKTSVTDDGILNVLSRLPEINSFGIRDILDPLQMFDELSEGAKTNLIEINVKCVTVSRIQTLKKLCPKLEKIRATFQEHPGPGATLNDLRLLPNLTQLSITVKEPFLLSQANLNDLAWNIGARLTVLRLAGDVYWEADLGLLAGHCPLLEELALPAATVPTKQSLAALQAPGTITLKNLQVLEVDCMTGVGPKAWAKDFNLSRQGLVAALILSSSLRRLLLRPTALVDDDLREILAHNRMPALEVVELYNCVLGIEAAQLLVDTCTNLHVLKGVRTWRGIALLDLVTLRKHARGHRRVSELKILP
ncbi:uncharacterized protein LOC108681019 [Hyalella azteca]|uniref:Uncharacterized protein LOC108681019 n=1 Tax=Hyalella azteca TaxID=294128 RepID=A0A8B7PJC3_HYAAZ|nr:uncharacterized protein LOC108681019 [Hyalella azteca]